MQKSVASRRPFSVWVMLTLLLVMMVSAAQPATAQNKMRRLNPREKEALKNFNKGTTEKSPRKKSFLDFVFKRRKNKDTGLSHAMKIQEKAVRRRMRQNRRKANRL